MRGRGARRDYTWPSAQRDLAMGTHPEVVACRLGVHVDDVLATADELGWAVSWKGPAADTILSAAERMFLR